MTYNPYTSDGRDLRVELAPYLHDGEELLWVGQPYVTAKYRPNPAILGFMLLWTGFALFWTITASAMGGAFGLFGLPFLAIGVGMLGYTIFGAKKQYQNTIYAVTDRRAIILETGRTSGMTEYVYSRLPSISMEGIQGTTGTIRFRSAVIYNDYPMQYGRRRTVNASYDRRSAFVGIDDVQEVYRLLSERIHG